MSKRLAHLVAKFVMLCSVHKMLLFPLVYILKGTGPLPYNIEPETLDLEDKMKLMTGR